MGEIEQVMAMIGAAAGTASNYSESLADVTQKLGVAADERTVRTIVESLVQATKEMEKNNQALEERLSASKQEITQLQQNLEAVRTESLTDPLTSPTASSSTTCCCGRWPKRAPRARRCR